MSAAEVAQDHASARRRLALVAAGEAGRLWGLVDPGRIAASWLELLPRLMVLLTGAQQAVAGRADDYLDEVLAEQRVSARTEGRVSAQSLAGVASDGRDLADLLYQPAISTLVGIKGGASVEEALAGGGVGLDMLVRTQVADAGRVADQVAMVARPQVTGYVRMLVGKSCSRCAILAGRRYGWSAGFQRHPRLPMRLHPHPGARGHGRRPAHRPEEVLRQPVGRRAGSAVHGGRRGGDQGRRGHRAGGERAPRHVRGGWPAVHADGHPGRQETATSVDAGADPPGSRR
ncbi:hypothetical protein ACFYUR_22030 [Micromonospora haikouensis]|uniref:hypothetical protein n=1 Tax=Micromonospora haikouensis TaxID=686309 RepID=UPI0036CAB029